MSKWVDECLDELARCSAWGYHADGPAASEPTALAALALSAHGRGGAAQAAVDWLMAMQSDDGSVGVTRQQAKPAWPTSLAVLAWTAALKLEDSVTSPQRKQGIRQRAIDWMLSLKGEIVTETEPLSHDRTLVGWPWIEGTHSWVEPTGLCVLALKATGYREHSRTREAVRLLIDRLLPTGGCNYGNTFVLGQKLLPHVQPTGLCLLALAGETIADPRLSRSIDYLRSSLAAGMATASMCYGLLGLAAHGERPKQASNWLETAYRRVRQRDNSPYKLAILALAALAGNCPLITLPRESAV
jgi:hypothetical protein